MRHQDGIARISSHITETHTSLRQRCILLALARSTIAFATTNLAILLTVAATANAQGPWKVEIRPSTMPLVTGACTPVRLDLVDATGKDSPRNPTGARVSISDFDMSVAGGDLVDKHPYRSANYFWEIWERIEARKASFP